MKEMLRRGTWLVIVSRKFDSTAIHFSVAEVYRVRISGKYRSLVPYYNISTNRINQDWPIVCEASNTSFNFFRMYTDNVTTVGGRDVFKDIPRKKLYKHTLIVDGAAFGQIVETFYRDYVHGKLDISVLESFEWALLSSALFKDDKEVQDVLANPENYGANDPKYDTWENFFEDYLNTIMHEKGMQGCSKSDSLDCYVKPCCYRNKPCDLVKLNAKDKYESILNLYGYSSKDSYSELWEQLP